MLQLRDLHLALLVARLLWEGKSEAEARTFQRVLGDKLLRFRGPNVWQAVRSNSI